MRENCFLYAKLNKDNTNLYIQNELTHIKTGTEPKIQLRKRKNKCIVFMTISCNGRMRHGFSLFS